MEIVHVMDRKLTFGFHLTSDAYRFLAIQTSSQPTALIGTKTILKHRQCNLSRLANFSNPGGFLWGALVLLERTTKEMVNLIWIL